MKSWIECRWEIEIDDGMRRDERAMVRNSRVGDCVWKKPVGIESYLLRHMDCFLLGGNLSVAKLFCCGWATHAHTYFPPISPIGGFSGTN